MSGEDGKGQAEIVEEITKGGLPSNLHVQNADELDALEVLERRTLATPDELEAAAARTYAAEAEPLAEAAGLVHGVEEPIGEIVTPAVCGQNYAAGGRVFPEKCSLPSGHKPRSSTANHFCYGIGWWA